MSPSVSASILRRQSDERLLALACDGHERAFEAIVTRYRGPLERYCRRVVPGFRAEDVVQQTFLNAWSAIERGAEIGDLRSWLFRIARNAALDAAARPGFDYDQLTEAVRLAPGPSGEVERRLVIRETLRSVSALPPNQREALLRTVQGESQVEIARDLQVSERAVRQLVHRARSALRSAATAVTPTPLLAAALNVARPGAGVEPVAELALGGGAAGGAGLLMKLGAVVSAAGAITLGPPQALPSLDSARGVASQAWSAATLEPRRSGRPEPVALVAPTREPLSCRQAGRQLRELTPSEMAVATSTQAGDASRVVRKAAKCRRRRAEREAKRALQRAAEEESRRDRGDDHDSDDSDDSKPKRDGDGKRRDGDENGGGKGDDRDGKDRDKRKHKGDRNGRGDEKRGDDDGRKGKSEGKGDGKDRDKRKRRDGE